ncbi:glycosyl hydrolase family 28-related protein [uncultured Cellulomonas sp.]|uniref:glycosyl hydrolase family 28-related protein n=1 Tax=uncultured Cellulomonas sp. TaxID=189682 RepID=UPI002605C4CF|nr:glycosyl hydrolase family 28-related protein [uncultured Cellulomonas sp.]
MHVLPRSPRPPTFAAASAGALALGLALAAVVVPPASAAPAAAEPDLGPNVVVVDPSMTTAEIQSIADGIHARQADDEMGTGRYSLLFRPGSYGTADDPLQIQVGYYTEVAGLGATPGDVRITGKVEVYNRCFDAAGAPVAAGSPGAECFALNNFWRGISNLTIDVNSVGQDDCRGGNNFWAVSQAVSMRRVEVTGGGLTLMDYCSGPSFASGGFIADSRADVVINGSQQQWLTRNSEIGSWSNGVWNQTFSGVVGAPDDAGYPDPPYTTLERTPVSREKPYLFIGADGAWNVRVPQAQQGSSGTSWAEGLTAGRTIPLRDFYVADPSDSVAQINAQLARGRHLLLTPGVYDVDRSIAVKRADTVVLGLGLATLTAVEGAVPLRLADRPGIVVAGVTIDAGTVESPVLLQVGTKNGNNGARTSSAANPTTLSDVYFRIGGPHVGKTDIALEVNSDRVLVDHTWVWRADHGVEDFDTAQGFLGDDERWVTNVGRNGVVVNGDDVTATGLFVEHFQEHNTVWNGERGRVVLYQNELPYDPPTQADWTTPDGTLGWAAYKVDDSVQQHQLWGGGVYVYNRNNPDIVTTNGYEVPRRPGVSLQHVMTKNLSGPGTITHVVNGVGDAVDGVPDPGDPDGYEDPSYVLSYP